MGNDISRGKYAKMGSVVIDYDQSQQATNEEKEQDLSNSEINKEDLSIDEQCNQQSDTNIDPDSPERKSNGTSRHTRLDEKNNKKSLKLENRLNSTAASLTRIKSELINKFNTDYKAVRGLETNDVAKVNS